MHYPDMNITVKHRLLNFTALVALLLPMGLAAQREAVVSGKFTFYGEGAMSRDECKMRALEGARVEAIKSEFGTIVTQDIMQHDVVNRQGESTFFSSLSSSEVQGEWIADTKEPVYQYSLDNDGNMAVTCTVTGRARELSNETVDFKTLALRNGNEERFADTSFNDGDDLKVLLKTPVDGYASVFMIDEHHVIYALLPYTSDNSSAVKVKRGKEYVFFDREKADESFGCIDELQLAASDACVYNRIYVVFSPNKYSRAIDEFTDSNHPRSMSYDTFNKWLIKSRKLDPQMSVKIINLKIKG